MRPMQLVRRECANYNSDGSCSGVLPEHLEDRGQGKKLIILPECKVKKQERCRYFESVIIAGFEGLYPSGDKKEREDAVAASIDYWKRAEKEETVRKGI